MVRGVAWDTGGGSDMDDIDTAERSFHGGRPGWPQLAQAMRLVDGASVRTWARMQSQGECLQAR